MSNPGPTVENLPQNISKQSVNDTTHMKTKKSDLDLNRNVERAEQHAGKKKSNRKLINFRKASSSTPASQDYTDHQTTDSYYSPAEFRSLVLEELRGNCLEWDISRVRIVFATFHRNSSGECSIRLGLKGELGRFNDSHILTLHPPAPKVPANKRRLFPKIPGTKSAQKVEALSSPTREGINGSTRLKSGTPQPDGDSSELPPNNNPSDAATSDCASATSADPMEPSRPLKSKSPTATSTLSLDRPLSPGEPNSTSHGNGDIPISTSNNCCAPTESLTTRDGMNILPNAGSANIAPSIRSPNNFPQEYIPTALTPSNREIGTATPAPGKEISDKSAPIHFPTSFLSAKPPDAAHAQADRRISYPHTGDSGLAPHNTPTAVASSQRLRVNSMMPNNTGSNPNQSVGDIYALATAPFSPQVTAKRQVTGIATGAFRVCARTVLDLKANVGAKPRTGCFHIADTRQVGECPSPIQDNTGVKELAMGDKPITLEDVVVLASTITSRASRHARAVHSEDWFLDAMWKGLHVVTGSGQANLDYPQGVDAAMTELLDDVMSRFRGEITKFRREISQIREAEDPRGEKRQKLQAEMQQQIDRFNKEIDVKIKATDALAKENQELELEMRRLQEGMQSEGKARFKDADGVDVRHPELAS